MSDNYSNWVNYWYANHIDDYFPDLVHGECEHCGESKMIIEYDDGSLACYFCGSTAEVEKYD